MELLFGARERLGVSAIAEMTFRERSTRSPYASDKPSAERWSSFVCRFTDVQNYENVTFWKKVTKNLE